MQLYTDAASHRSFNLALIKHTSVRCCEKERNSLTRVDAHGFMMSAAGLNDDVGHERVMSPSAQPALPNGVRGDHEGRASEHGEPQASGSDFNPEGQGASVDESTERISAARNPNPKP